MPCALPLSGAVEVWRLRLREEAKIAKSIGIIKKIAYLLPIKALAAIYTIQWRVHILYMAIYIYSMRFKLRS